MIDQVTDRLSKWIEELLGGIKPSLTAPTAADSTLGVNLYLFELVDEPLRRNTSRPPLQPALRYLVTTTADEPKDAHRLLGTLVFAAMDHPDFEVELEPLPINTWSAFEIAPRPAFILRVPLPREWPASEAPLVTDGAETRTVPTAVLHGLVLGPEAVPLARARVELPNLYRSTYTDPRGRFSLAGVPAGSQVKTLLIKAKKKEFTVTVTETGTIEEPVVINLNLFDRKEA